MIKVYIEKEKAKDSILNVTITGHSSYDVPGKDIVCSAVSALSIGAINSVEALLGIELKAIEDQQQGGYLFWDVPNLEDSDTNEKLQLLMKAMVYSLLNIEEIYPKYIRVSIEAS